MSGDLFTQLWDRARVRTPRGGLVAITEAEVDVMLAYHESSACPMPWDPPTAARTTLFGTDAIVIDRPPR